MATRETDEQTRTVRLTADRVFTGSVVLGGREGTVGYVEVAGQRVVAVGEQPRITVNAANHVDTLAPGYVDVHCHGGGGATFVTTDPAQVATAIAAHRAHGTTSLVASLVTGGLDDLVAQASVLADAVEAGELAGIHYEGPWLSERQKGAHPADRLVDPRREDVERLLAATRGTLAQVTIAPEKPGALEAIALLAERGVVVALGHTAADYVETVAGIAAGGRGATHLFNAMAGLHHREPGPLLALLEAPQVMLELIADGVHVRPELIRYVLDLEPDRVVLITDAMAAAGFGDGDYVLGELEVQVRHGIARTVIDGAIAGSTLTMAKAVQVAVEAGVPEQVAINAATANPARYLGFDQVGVLEAGRLADLIELDAELNVRRVMRRGTWL